MYSFIAAIAVNPFYLAHREYRRIMQYAGLALSCVAIVLCAFAQSPMMILLSLGVMYPLGASCQYLPALPLLLEWFQAK